MSDFKSNFDFDKELIAKIARDAGQPGSGSPRFPGSGTRPNAMPNERRGMLKKPCGKPIVHTLTPTMGRC